MKVLVINAGSSSLKYQLIDMADESVLAKGNCERIGDGGFITHKTADGKKIAYEADFPTHTEAFVELIKVLTEGEGKVISDMKEIGAIGHRIVQGAERFSESVLVTESVIETLEEISDLAPLHNPAHVLAIKACRKVFDESVPEVVVFDTAFHQTMPPYAYMFAVPYQYYEKYHVRRYGFHGTSHRFVSHRLAELTGKKLEDMKVVSCHLGNGSSITAIQGGKSIDTSMGFTPLDGIIMGTRSGCVDNSLVAYVAEKENLTPKQVSEILNKKSGYFGIAGYSDHRDLLAAAQQGNERAQLAEDMLHYHIKRYVGAYAAAMGGIDALIFTGGIGENSPEVRAGVCKNLQFLGIEIDEKKNVEQNHQEVNLTAAGARVQTWVVPTNEELLIARDTAAIVEKMGK